MESLKQKRLENPLLKTMSLKSSLLNNSTLPLSRGGNFLLQSSTRSSSLQNSYLTTQKSCLTSGLLRSDLTSKMLGKPSAVMSNIQFSVKELHIDPLLTVKHVKKSEGVPVHMQKNTSQPVYKLSFYEQHKPELNKIFASSETKRDFVEQQDAASEKAKEIAEVKLKKISLVNLVSVALLNAPKLDNLQNPTRLELLRHMKEMSKLDPEFIVKLALYTRKHLNVRSVANFMLAYAAYLPEVRVYLRKYFSKAVVLPSDWLNVAEVYQTFFDASISEHSIPTALRRAMVEKFADFDEYQLSKYNKDRNVKKTVLVDPNAIHNQCNATSDNLSDVDELLQENIKEFELKSYTLKQLVRKLHITEPVYNVMCLIGKKYPEDSEAFYQSRLPGMWQEEKAGKRMKLQTAETWETQVSLNGNKPSTWQQLIDHNKLPFMAMLRNLRNLVLCGLPEKYHNKIISRLKNTQSVMNSKQFPFRFLSAYNVIEEMKDALAEGGGVTDPADASKNRMMKKLSKKLQYHYERNDVTTNLLERYQKALDTSMKIATVYNVAPIPGSTIIIIDVSESDTSKLKCSVTNMCLLLGLMCKYHSEGGQLILWNSSNDRFVVPDTISDASILGNIKSMFLMIEQLKQCTISSGLIDHLNAYLSERTKINSFLLLRNKRTLYFDAFMLAYRVKVNPTTLLVDVSLATVGKKVEMETDNHVLVSGFTDQVLRYIAERGSDNQLSFIENIDVTYDLQDVKIRKVTEKSSLVLTPMVIERPCVTWKTVRVFISSTFCDMHGERNLLTRYVFPELRRWCFNYCLNLYEVDLRWGITEKQATSENVVNLCLDEVSRSDFFVGILGSRLGWSPDISKLSESPYASWLGKQGKCSITELEMRLFCDINSNPQDNAFFYFRDDSFIKKLSKAFRKDFLDSPDKRSDLLNLKEWLVLQGMEVFQDYPCHWGASNGDVPMVWGLEEFGQRVMNNLWTGIKRQFIDNETEVSKQTTETSGKHLDFAITRSEIVVGREVFVAKMRKVIYDLQNKEEKNIIVVTGKSGYGKTSVMCKLVSSYPSDVSCYFIDAGDTTLQAMLVHLFNDLNLKHHAGFQTPTSFSDLSQKFGALLKTISKHLHGNQILVFVDGLDQVELAGQANHTAWIPENLPKGLVLVVSCYENSRCLKQLMRHTQLAEVVQLRGMEYPERAALVRKIFACHGKQLDESAFNNQMDFLLSKSESTSPLYLQLACEELRLHGVYEKLNSFIRCLAQSVPQLIQMRLKVMEKGLGKELVGNALCLLVCSRTGLTDDELYETLNILHTDDSSTEKLVVPLVSFHKLLQNIKMFALESVGGSMHLFGEVRRVVSRCYLESAGLKYVSKVHNALASYYRLHADPLKNYSWFGNEDTAFEELAYHMASSRQYSKLKEVLCDVRYIDRKVHTGKLSQLLQHFLTCAGEMKDEQLNQVFDFVRENTHILSRYPNLLRQQILNSNLPVFMEYTSQPERGTITWRNKPLAANSGICSLTITGMQESVLSVCTSTDGSMIACGLKDGLVHLYDRETAKELRSFVGHSCGVTSCCFAGANKLCSSSSDGQTSVWDVTGGHRIHLLKLQQRKITSSECTVDGRFLLTSSYDISHPVILWSLADGKPAAKYNKSTHPVNCAVFDPNNETLVAIGGWEKKVVVWDTINNVNKMVLKGHKSSIQSLAYAPRGLFLASGALSGDIMLWATGNGTLVGQMACISPGKLVYTNNGLIAATNTTIKVWSGNLGSPHHIYGKNANDGVSNYASAVAAHMETVAVGYQNGYVSVYPVSPTAKCTEWQAHATCVRSLCYIKDLGSMHLLTAGNDNLVKRWDMSNGSCITVMSGHTAPVRCVRTRGSIIISASDDSTARVWPGIILCGDANNNDCSGVLRGHYGRLTCCDLSTCETMAVTGAADKILIIWDLNKFVALKTIHQAHNDVITACSWSDVGNYVITGSNDFSLKLWDAKHLLTSENVKAKVTFEGHASAVNSVQYKFGCVTSSSSDGAIKVWSHKGTEITTIHPLNGRINGCDLFAPVSQTASEWCSVVDRPGVQDKVRATTPVSLLDVVVYGAGDDGFVRSYHPFRPFLKQELFGHADLVTDIHVSRKQDIIASSGMDNCVKVWNITDKMKDSSSQHSGEVTCIVSYANVTATSGRDGIVKLYNSTKVTDTWNVGKPVTSIAFLSENSLVVGDSEGGVGVWCEGVRIAWGNLHGGVEMVRVNGKLVVVSNYRIVVVYVWRKHRLQQQSRSQVIDDEAAVVNVQLRGNQLLEVQSSSSQKTVTFVTKDLDQTTQECFAHETAVHQITCVQFVTSTSWLVGDVRGYVAHASSDSLKERKLHDGSISGIAVLDDVMITCSKDGSVKAWRTVWETDEIIQIGVFHCRSPVVCMSPLSKEGAFSVGCASGFLEFLSIVL